MKQQDIVKALAPLGEPIDGQPWLDYARFGISAADAKTLVNLIEDDRFLESEADDYWVPLHAWRALKGMMPAGLNDLIAIFALLIEDEWALEEIPQVIAAAKDAALPPLKACLLDLNNDVWVRLLAVECLTLLAQTLPNQRAAIVNSMIMALQGLTNTDERGLAGGIIVNLMDIRAIEAMDAIRDAFAADQVDWTVCGDVEDIELAMGLRTQRETPALRDLTAQDEDEDELDLPSIEPYVRTEPKVGRNDPCPCGSGKKYKKCCFLK